MLHIERLWVVSVLVAVASGVPAQEITEDFAQDPDPKQFTYDLVESYCRGWCEGGRLYLGVDSYTDSTSDHAALRSEFQLHGDFAVSVLYEVADLPTTPTGSMAIGILLNPFAPSQHNLQLSFRPDGAFFSNWPNSEVIPVGNNSGRLEMTRQAGILSTWFEETGGSKNLLGQHAFAENPVDIALFAWRSGYTDPAVTIEAKASFDDFAVTCESLSYNPVVLDVVAETPGNRMEQVEVEYTVFDYDDSHVIISAVASLYGGNNWIDVVYTKNGDIGLVATGETRRRFYWNAETDLPGVDTDSLLVKVIDDDGP